MSGLALRLFNTIDANSLFPAAEGSNVHGDKGGIYVGVGFE
jgi:hypothetical protein